ncbi:MAG: DUF4390 domain-containing protein [Vicinamibacterales bacterium]
MPRAPFVLAVALLALTAFAPPTPPPQTLQVVPLSRGGEVLVSFTLGARLTDDIRAAIQSGLTVKFVYKVDLRRSALGWFDRTVASATVTASVRYDTLTRLYHVSRTVDDQIDWADATDSEQAAWSALTHDFVRMSLFHGVELESNAEYYVRVRAHTTPRNASFIWPWEADDVMGSAKFTFIR